MLLNGHVILVNMMTWPDKRDFRLRNQELRAAGQIGDIMQFIRNDAPGADYDYEVVVHEAGTDTFEQTLLLCTEATPHSTKRWGYAVVM